MDATSQSLESALAELTGLARHAWPATEADAVAGVRSGMVVEPETEDEVAAVLRYANGAGLAVIPRGAGTQMDYGAAPRRADIVLSLARLNHIIEHAPHDLTVTVEAGTILATLQERLGEARQWLALDPPVSKGATIGGVIATSVTGPRRLRFGGVRDQIIGVRVALADGTIARGGGKVVKNVAGYDLPKLFTGALGTLGVVLSASFRLYPLPHSSGTVEVEAATPQAACAVAVAALAEPVTPTVMDVFPLEQAGGQYTLAVRFESAVAEAITAQITTIERLAHAAGLETRILRGAAEKGWWHSRETWMSETVSEGQREEVAVKASLLPSDVGAWLAWLEAAQEGGAVSARWRAHAGHGLVYARLAGETEALAGAVETLRAAAVEQRGSLVVTAMPPGLRGRVDPWGPVNGLEIMRRLKERFDPQGIMNPGRFVGGI